MLTVQQLKSAFDDPSLSESELAEMCHACNVIAEIFLEYRTQDLRSEAVQDEGTIQNG